MAVDCGQSPPPSIFPMCNKTVVLDGPQGQLWEATRLIRRMLQSLAAPTSNSHL